MEFCKELGNMDRNTNPTTAHMRATQILVAALNLCGPEATAVGDAFMNASDRIGFKYGPYSKRIR